MLQFIYSFWNWFYSIVNMLRTATLDFGDFYVSYFDVIIGFLVIGIVISVVWKGAKA